MDLYIEREGRDAIGNLSLVQVGVATKVPRVGPDFSSSHRFSKHVLKVSKKLHCVQAF